MKDNMPLVNENKSIKETMSVIDRYELGLAFIVDKNNKFIGLVTDGDIRRALLRGTGLDKPVKDIINKNCITVYNYWPEKQLKEFLKSRKVIENTPEYSILKIPILNKEGYVVGIKYIGRKGSLKTDINGDISKKNKIRSVNKVLVIGGAGYLGAVLIRKLIKKGYKVRVLDNLMYGDDGIKELTKNKKFELVKGDIRNISDIIESIKDVDAVIHLAAIVGDPACATNPRETLEINTLATKMIAEICKYFQINRFIFSSTCSVYGESHDPDTILTEESPLNPVSLYAETKIKCEESILSAMDNNFSPTVFRMATLYGYSPNMRFDLVVNLLTAKASFDGKITIFGGEQWRPFLHVEDAADAYIKCLDVPIEKARGKIFNLATENYKIIEIGNIINSVYPKSKMEIDKKITDKRNYRVSSDEIFRALSFKPKKKIKEGIEEIKSNIKSGTVKDYRDPKYRFSKPQM